VPAWAGEPGRTGDCCVLIGTLMTAPPEGTRSSGRGRRSAGRRARRPR
jgi:hypothetical protein